MLHATVLLGRMEEDWCWECWSNTSDKKRITPKKKNIEREERARESCINLSFSNIILVTLVVKG